MCKCSGQPSACVLSPGPFIETGGAAAALCEDVCAGCVLQISGVSGLFEYEEAVHLFKVRATYCTETVCAMHIKMAALMTLTSLECQHGALSLQRQMCRHLPERDCANRPVAVVCSSRPCVC
jgi:hypothetical protein